jgi:branched-subunit amino acid transport protein AzlD
MPRALLMISVTSAVIYTFALGAVIFFCRVLPFILFRDSANLRAEGTEQSGVSLRGRFISMVEKAAPPVAMTVLAFNAMAGPVKAEDAAGAPALAGIVLAAAGLTALLHVWKRNALLSIVAGTGLYMILERLFLS